MMNKLIPVMALNRGHRDQILAHLLKLSSEARRLRFGMELQDAGIERYVDHIDYENDGLFGIFDDNIMLIAFTHAARAGNMVEFGVSVLPDYRGRGYGTALFAKSELFARNHYIHRMYMHCLRENEPMMKIARRAKMNIVFDAGEVDSYLELPPADTASLTADVTQNEYAQFDLALKKGVHNLELASQGMQSLFSTYLTAFTPRSRSLNINQSNHAHEKSTREENNSSN